MLSVITPSHDTRYLNECYRSLTLQTNQDWEWIVLLNGEAEEKLIGPLNDDRVHIYKSDSTLIGALKLEAAKKAKGDILVELDHDDWLMPTALELVQKAYSSCPETAMIWSDYTYMEENGDPSSYSYGGDWEYTSEFAYGKRWHRVVGKPTTKENISRIWTAPNHLRAWPVKPYMVVGGHRPISILDDQDLMQRLFRVGLFVHIPEMLYIQRRHQLSTQIDTQINANIQTFTVELGDEWLASL